MDAFSQVFCCKLETFLKRISLVSAATPVIILEGVIFDRNDIVLHRVVILSRTFLLHQTLCPDAAVGTPVTPRYGLCQSIY